MNSSNFLNILQDDALDGDGVKRPKFAGFSSVSCGRSASLRCCGLVPGVLKSDKFMLMFMVLVESMEYELGRWETVSTLFGGVISTFTSTGSPASEDD